MRERRTPAFSHVAALLLWLVPMPPVAALAARPAVAQADQTARQLWQLRLPAELETRLYEIAIVPEGRVVATTPAAILEIDGLGTVRLLRRLDTGGPVGESATLSSDGSRAGILIHERHAVSGFRLLDLPDQTLASLTAPRNFHYRLAPDGATFVGIDAGGAHLPISADRFLYRFYDQAGRELAEIESESPQPADSAYTPDGTAFVVNNAEGLAAFRVADGAPLWQVKSPVRFFAAAATPTQLAIASSNEQRNRITAYRGGNPLWNFALTGNVRNLAISPDGAFVLATAGQRAHLLTPASGTPLWSLALPDDFTINSAVVNDDGVVALGAQHGNLDRGIVQVLDRNRRVLLERELSHGRSNGWIPTVQFDIAGTRILARTLEELILITTE